MKLNATPTGRKFLTERQKTQNLKLQKLEIVRNYNLFIFYNYYKIFKKKIFLNLIN